MVQKPSKPPAQGLESLFQDGKVEFARMTLIEKHVNLITVCDVRPGPNQYLSILIEGKASFPTCGECAAFRFAQAGRRDIVN